MTQVAEYALGIRDRVYSSREFLWGQTLFPVYRTGRNEYGHGMARPLRIEFPNAIYHVMARGNARQALFHEAEEYGRFREGLARTVERCDWRLLAFACLPNHVHLFLQTPQANLSQGMRYLLSGYANWYAKRYHRSGYLFQGRFRGELIEDAGKPVAESPSAALSQK